MPKTYPRVTNTEFRVRNAKGAGLQPIATTPILVDQVYQSLLGAIADCSLRPGQRIRQAELASSLGVSRQPVSHALQLLKHQGLVQDSGRKGLEVTPIDPTQIRQLYEVRAALDALAAKLAAARAVAKQLPADQVKRLNAALSAGKSLGSEATLPMLVQADVSFHQALYQLSGNPAIPETLSGQWSHLRRSMTAVLSAETYRRRAWAEHAEISRLILSGKVDEAGEAAYEHADNAGRETERRLLDEQPRDRAA